MQSSPDMLQYGTFVLYAAPASRHVLDAGHAEALEKKLVGLLLCTDAACIWWPMAATFAVVRALTAMNSHLNKAGLLSSYQTIISICNVVVSQGTGSYTLQKRKPCCRGCSPLHRTNQYIIQLKAACPLKAIHNASFV